MDPGSITAAVLTALAAAGAAGATTGVQEAASDMVKRAYDRLRDRLRALWRYQRGTRELDERAFEDAEKLVERFQRKPDDWASDLHHLLVEAGAEDDIELKRRADSLRGALEAQNQRRVVITNSQGIQYAEKGKNLKQNNIFLPRSSQ